MFEKHALIREKQEKYVHSCTLLHMALDEYRPTLLLATEWIARNFHGRGKAPDLHIVPGDWHDGYIYINVVLKDGEAWNEILDLLELLAEQGVPADAWTTSEDARNFARTYSANHRLKCGVDMIWQITLALREGNLGGCRRVLAGVEPVAPSSPRDRYVLICDSPLSETEDHG